MHKFFALFLLIILTGATPVISPLTVPLATQYGGTATSTVQCANILAFGGVADGITDNTTAFNNAVSSQPSSNICISFGAGKFLFNSSLTVTLPSGLASFTLLGQSQDTTQLIWPTGNGIRLTTGSSDNSFHLRNMSIITKTAGMVSYPPTTTGFSVTATGYNNYAFSAINDITDVSFGGPNGYNIDVNNYWGTSVSLVGVNNVNFNSDIFTEGSPADGTQRPTSGGDAVTLSGTVATTYAVVFNFTGCTFNGVRNGIVYGPGIQGVTVAQSNWVGSYTAIGVPPAETGLDELVITAGSQFGYLSGYTINILSPMADFIMAGGDLLLIPPSAVGVNISTGSLRSNISGTTFAAVTNIGSQTGIASASSVAIDDNWFDNLGTAITLSGNNNRVQSNIYTNDTISIVNTGTGSVITGLPTTYATVNGAVNNGAGLVRLTVGTTTGLVTGEQVLVSGVGGLGSISTSTLATPITVVDTTHLDLVNITFSGSYTGGGIVASLP